MVEFYIVAEQRRGRRKAADEIGNPVTIENIPLAVVLCMNEGIGRGHAVAKTISRRHDRLRAPVSMGHGGKIGLAKIVARAPGAVEREISSSRAIAAGRAPKNAGKVVSAPSRAGDGGICVT